MTHTMIGSPSKGHKVVGLRTYHGMSFKEGEAMEVLDDSDPEELMALNLSTGERGHVPKKYVMLQSSINSEE